MTQKGPTECVIQALTKCGTFTTKTHCIKEGAPYKGFTWRSSTSILQLRIGGWNASAPLEHVRRCLKQTVEDGLVFAPVADLNVKLRVDEDFAGLRPCEDESDLTFANSRMGFVVCASPCCLTWKSEPFPDHVPSTCEAKCSCSSVAIKELLQIPHAATTDKSIPLTDHGANQFDLHHSLGR